MRWFRRDDETLNEKLLREAGLDPPNNVGEPGDEVDLEAQPKPFYPQPAYDSRVARILGWVGMRTPESNVLATADAASLRGDRYEFVAVPDGSLIVDESVADELWPLADAVERQLPPPYRAVAVRQEGSLWTVSANAITVLEASFDGGEELELASVAGNMTFRIDGNEADPATAPTQLHEAGERAGAD